jgi:hypothetical protein
MIFYDLGQYFTINTTLTPNTMHFLTDDNQFQL